MEFVVTEDQRKVFEDHLYQKRFIKSIRLVGDGPMGLQPVNCPTKEEFLLRDPLFPQGYADPYVCAMWFGYQLALEIQTMAK